MDGRIIDLKDETASGREVSGSIDETGDTFLLCPEVSMVLKTSRLQLTVRAVSTCCASFPRTYRRQHTVGSPERSLQGGPRSAVGQRTDGHRRCDAGQHGAPMPVAPG